MLRRPSGVLLAVAVALATAGVTVVVLRSGGGGGPPSEPRAAVVDALATRPRDVADSARYVVRYIQEVIGVGVGATVTYEGVADLKRQRFLARVRFASPEKASQEHDSFVFARWEYVRPAGESRWRRRFFDPSEVGSPTPELGIVGQRGENLVAPPYAGDLETRRRIVDALIGDVVGGGRDDHHGSAVWHYRATVDPERVAGRLPEPLVTEMGRWQEGQRRRDVDVWLDGRGRLRKLSIFYGDEQGRGFRVENEFWDFGGPGRLELPSDLGDPTAVGGEGVTSFTLDPGVELDGDSPGLSMRVFERDEPGSDVSFHVDDQPAVGAERRRRELRITPAAGRHLEPGEHRLVDARGTLQPPPRTFDITAPEIDERCPRDRPRSGTLTLSEAVMYEQSFYVRLHLRFSVTCRPPSGGAPVSFTGEARFHALT